jgi:hypothetical protein
MLRRLDAEEGAVASQQGAIQAAEAMGNLRKKQRRSQELGWNRALKSPVSLKQIVDIR